MSKARVGSYASIALGSLAIICAAVGIATGSAKTEVSVESAGNEIPASARNNTVAEQPSVESPPIAAGFTAYQDEDGNFVAPPPGTQLPTVATQQSGAPAAQWQNSIAGGGVGADASGFRMAQRAVVTADGEIGVTCGPEHDHDGGECE